MRCKFKVAWAGQCTNETQEGSEYCEEHANRVCCSCGEKATHDCQETMGLICGAPLCDNCEDELSPMGTSTGRHCKKEEQKYTPWYMRSDKDNDHIRSDQAIPYYEGQIHGAQITSLVLMRKTTDEVANYIAKKKQAMYEYMKSMYPSAIA